MPLLRKKHAHRSKNHSPRHMQGLLDKDSVAKKIQKRARPQEGKEAVRGTPRVLKRD